MKFRPCIDIHNGSVKQIVGGTLSDRGNQAEDNFVSEYDAAFYANMYREDGLTGGHIILLNKADSEYYEADDEVKSANIAFCLDTRYISDESSFDSVKSDMKAIAEDAFDRYTHVKV